MKNRFVYIKVLITILLLCFMYVFANQRNNKRSVSEPKITLLGDKTPFITEANVSKLLIQNQQPLTDQPKEVIDLNQLEEVLNRQAMVKHAEVFMAVDGKLEARVEQKKPIARVIGKAHYYVDADGLKMPLSNNYTARVPLITGILKETDIPKVFKLAKLAETDDFLKKHITEIHLNSDKSVSFRIRKSNIVVELGHLDKLEKKINNFKVFYQKALKDNLLAAYSKVNLKFDKQVICTKK